MAIETKRARLRNLFVAILLFQFVASITIWLTQWLPPIIGFGSFSIPVDFRLLLYFLLGSIAAQLVLLAYFLAFGPQKVWRRLIVYLGILICTLCLNVVGALIFMAINSFSFRSYDIYGYLGFVWIVGATFFGLSVIAWIIRIYCGKKLVKDNREQPSIPRSETLIELAILIFLVSVIFFVSLCYAAEGLNGMTSLISLGLVSGIIAGGILFLLVLCILGPQSKRLTWIAVLTITGLVILPTVICGYLSDYPMFLLPPGYGWAFFPVSFAFAILLVQLLLLRAMGYRLVNGQFESKRARLDVVEEVVDPFSD